MSRFTRRALTVAALVAAPLFAVAGPAFAANGGAADGGSHKPPKKPAVTVDSAAYEAQVVTLTNNERTANGCSALRTDTRLTAAARGHGADMVGQNFFSHTGSDGSTFVAREAAAGYPRNGASAENIAWGYRTPRDVVTGWMNSPGHRANILNCGSVAVGVGLVFKSDGTSYWTQDFGRV